MRFVTKYMRKLAIALFGTLVLIIGIVLIPLPGPGLLVCFAALVIFSSEFDWFKPYVDKSRKFFESVKKPK